MVEFSTFFTLFDNYRKITELMITNLPCNNLELELHI